MLVGALLSGCGPTGKNDSAVTINRHINPAAFESAIDFDVGDFSSQLDSGWYDLEEDEENGYRWISDHAIAYLKNEDSAKAIQLSFFIPDIKNYQDSIITLSMNIDGFQVLNRNYQTSGDQIASGLLPKESKDKPVLRVDVFVNKYYAPLMGFYDPRKLTVIVDALELTSSQSAEDS